jgi:hypothetical protein
MQIAIMQPYFFPYIGYFQLINAVDEFVVYDDVNFIKQGWIAKNKILLDNQEFNFTLQLNGASSFKTINQIEVGNNKSKLLKTIDQAYKKAPFYKEAFPVIEEILGHEEENLGKFLSFSLSRISKYLKIRTTFLLSSEIKKNNELKGQDKVIELCKKLKADHYINAIGGRDLYNKSDFMNNGIELHFIQTGNIKYKQFNEEFVPYLSIIDALMFNSTEKIDLFLNDYQLI